MHAPLPIVPHYQAVVDATGRCLFHEVLIRGRREVGVAGALEMLQAYAAWGHPCVLDLDMLAAIDKDIAGKNMNSLSVNVAAPGDREVFSALVNLSQKLKAKGGQLIVEMPEAGFDYVAGECVDWCRDLALNDIGLAADDFGKGLMTISALDNLPTSIVKLDIALVRTACSGSRNSPVAQAVIKALCADGLVVAEGVETACQFEQLKSLGCQGFQGYYFSRPSPIQECQTGGSLKPTRKTHLAGGKLAIQL